MALNLAKASPVALRNAAQGLLDKNQYAEAENHLLEILRRDINDPAALSMMSHVCMAKGMAREALASIMSAVNAKPDEPRYKERFIELAGAIAPNDYGELAERAILECLKSGEKLDCSRIRVLWLSHLVRMPAFHAAFALADKKVFDPANKAFFESLSDFKALFTPFFLLGIRYIVATDALFEEFITHIRKHLFESLRYGKKKFSAEESLTLAEALAHYAFHTDYILDVTAEEQKEIDTLRKSIENGAETDPAHIALFACYAPLYTLKNAAEIAKTVSSSSIADVIRRQIAEYNELQNIAAAITAITSVDDAVSRQVQEQYEEFPYPRWVSFSTSGILNGWKMTSRNDALTKKFHGKKTRILIAGCGTGKDAIALAGIFPDADVLAVDLSLSSLAYAARKAEERRVTNITFRQADILRLGALDQKFDYIVSGGVLHHMEDPVRGWKVLCGLLKPDGLMTIGLYSRIGRKAILAAQEIVKQKRYASDTASMRAFRRNGPQLLERSALETLTQYTDYYYMTMYRDLLFNVQEHNYDIPEISDILKELNLDFISFNLHSNITAEYRRQYPGDATLQNLENWHHFEEKNPSIFRAMYLFWCRKPL